MFLDLFLEVWDAIKRNKLRAAATGFAVTSGIFLLIVLLGAGNGLIHTLEANSGEMDLDAVSIDPGWTSEAFGGYEQGRHIELDDTDGELSIAIDPNRVLSYHTEFNKSVTITTDNNKTLGTTLKGGTPYMFQSNKDKVIAGRLLNQRDLDEKRRVAVIAAPIAERLFGKDAEVVSRYLKIDGSMYQIVGVLYVKDNTSRNAETVFVPQTTLRLVYHLGNKADEIMLRTQGLARVEVFEVFEKVLRKALAIKHVFSPEDQRAVWISGGGAQAETMDDAFSAIRSAFWFLGILTLLSGITGVSNIMLISVRERTHEFGIRKALGARSWHIIIMVILESVLITTVFGYIGMTGGIAFCEYMNAAIGSSTLDIGEAQIEYFQDPTVGLDICIEATLVMIMAGAVAGFIPARKATKIKPIEALQAR